jgi:hypothetical protein
MILSKYEKQKACKNCRFPDLEELYETRFRVFF